MDDNQEIAKTAEYGRALEDVRNIISELLAQAQRKESFFDSESYRAEGAVDALEELQENILRLLPKVASQEEIPSNRCAVVCPNWRWVPGMRVIPAGGVPPGRILDGDGVPRFGSAGTRISSFDLPDFSDLTTLWCLVGLVEEVWPDAVITTGTEFSVDVGTRMWSYKTEPDFVSALVEALEASSEESP